jgi:hypothetical protein
MNSFIYSCESAPKLASVSTPMVDAVFGLHLNSEYLTELSSGVTAGKMSLKLSLKVQEEFKETNV